MADILDGLRIVPLSAIPAQRFQVVLNNQNCIITLKKREKFLYFSLNCNGNVVTQNTICGIGNNLVPYNNRYFVGSLFFIDMNGYDVPPTYELLNTRYRLVYVPLRFDTLDTLDGR